MEETKRKTKTSAAVKNRYNAKVYDGITVKLRKDLVKAFKEKCAAEGISQAQVIKKAVLEYLGDAYTPTESTEAEE